MSANVEIVNIGFKSFHFISLLALVLPKIGALRFC